MTLQTVQPQVHAHLYAELPRFFGGPMQVLRELLQNALRAGASTAQVTYDGEFLTVTDNGPGCADPQVLLTVAHSGWEGVTDPAGMGILSTFNPDFVQSVTFRSQDWAFTLTPDAFARGETAWVIPQETPTFGFEVLLHLARPLDVPALLREARARVPLTVTLNGEVVPVTELPGDRFPLACGEIVLREHTYRDPKCTVAYWEGFPLSAAPLRTAITPHLSPPEQLYLDAHSFILLPLADSGLRPKLPDRTLLLDTPALHDAAQEIAALIRSRVQQLVGGIDLTRDVLTEEDVDTQKNTLAARVRSAWLTHHGYVQQFRLDPHKVAAYFGDDDEDDDIGGYLPVRVRTAQGVSGTIGESASVEALGLPVSVITTCYEAPDERVRVQAGTPLPSSLPGTSFIPDVRVVPTLSVQDRGVPWVVTGTLLYLRGDAPEAEATLRAHLGTIGGCLLAELWEEGDRYELRELVDAPGTLTAQELGEAALYALIQAHFPERRQAQTEVNAALRAVEEATTALGALSRLPAGLAPEGTEAYLTALGTLRDTQAARAATLREQHRLE